jgi:hypothetical protein
MPAFAREVQAGASRVLLVHAEADPLLQEPANAGRTALDGEADGLLVAQAGAGVQRVLHVILERVVFVEHCRDAALRPERAAA